jgi:hypothetical protein
LVLDVFGVVEATGLRTGAFLRACLAGGLWVVVAVVTAWVWLFVLWCADEPQPAIASAAAVINMDAVVGRDRRPSTGALP